MSRFIEHRPPDGVDVVKVIKIYALRGDGTSDNPVRRVYQYFDMSGNLLFERDTISPQ